MVAKADNGIKLVPELYAVPADKMDQEPGSLQMIFVYNEHNVVYTQVMVKGDDGIKLVAEL